MRDVDERRVDALAELDDLGAHLVAELGVQVGEGLVHEEHLGLAHNGAPNGHALPLTTGKRLGLAVKVLGDTQGLRRLANLLVNLVLGNFAELQGEGHVVVHGHVGVQGVALEDHGDVAVLGGHLVHDLAVDGKLTARDALEAGNHAQRRGLAAAGGADKDNKLAVGDVEVEVLNGHDALVGDLEVALLLGLGGLLAKVVLLGLLDVRIDLGNVLQADFCHGSRIPSLGRSRGPRPHDRLHVFEEVPPPRDPERVPRREWERGGKLRRARSLA